MASFRRIDLHQRPLRTFLLFSCLAISAWTVVAAQQEKPNAVVMTQEGKAAPAPAANGYVGRDVCATCHEDISKGLSRTTHGQTETKAWDGAASCESCHGPGQAHVDAGGDKNLIRRPATLPPPEQSAICLNCHEKGNRSHWQGSPHDNRNLSCLSCHRIHHPMDKPVPHALLARGTEFDTCLTCHLKRKAALLKSAHMPLREGSMTCTSCHNPHGSIGPSQLKQESVNENCYSCHAEKRAPVLWEHPPVRESCTICHDPHGSLHPRLQIVKPPRLCQQCHDETRHPTQPYADASAAPEFFPNSRMFDRGCVNCHSMIHGSNHPAGNRFLR